MKLQRQLSNGNWLDCGERTEHFLALCCENNGLTADGEIAPIFRATRALTRDEVVSALERGIILRNSRHDWYSNCRDGDFFAKKQAAAQARYDALPRVKCACGHTVLAALVMNASLGSSCPECYDRMSD